MYINIYIYIYTYIYIARERADRSEGSWAGQEIEYIDPGLRADRSEGLGPAWAGIYIYVEREREI